MHVPFFKYQGTGNDFVIIDDREASFDPRPELISTMCDRRFGIGGDGLILCRQQKNTDFQMVYFNSDGYPGTMCGNGGRCIVKWAWDSGLIGKTARFDAPDGMHRAEIGEQGLVSLQMSEVNGIAPEKEAWVLDTGSPHHVIFTDRVDQVDVFSEGRTVRYSPDYSQGGINVNFVQIQDENAITVRTYERGVEAETYSCGTGVIASAIAAYFQQGLKNSYNQITVYTRGGKLEVSFSANEQGQITDVWLTGPAQKVFQGTYENQ